MSRRGRRQRAGFEHEASRLRKLAGDSDVLLTFSGHALVEMAKDRLVKIDIANMLKRCVVTRVEDTGGEEGWRAEGTDNDGRKITALVVVYESIIKIKVVTAWTKS